MELKLWEYGIVGLLLNAVFFLPQWFKFNGENFPLRGALLSIDKTVIYVSVYQNK